MNGSFTRFLSAVALSCTLSAMVPAQVPIMQQPARLDRDLDMISNLIRLGDFDRALSYLDQVRTTYGEHPRLDNMYKKVYAMAKMYPEWEEMLARQLHETPGDGLLIAELGCLKFLQNDVDEADSLWNRALSVGGGDVTVYLYVAGYRLQFGDYDGAINTYKRGKLAMGSPTAFSYELAAVYESQRNYPEAVRELFLSLEQSPGRKNTVKTRIRGFVNDSDDPEPVVKAVEKGVEMNPENVDLVEILGDLYLALGRMDEALATYKRIGDKLNDDGRSLCKFAERCLESRFYDAAIGAVDEYFRVSRKDDNGDRALYIKGKAQREGGHIKEALATLASLAEESSNRKIAEQATFLLGLLYSEDLDDCATAIGKWDSLTRNKANPEIADMASLETASCYLKIGNFAASESVLTVLTGNPDAAASQKGMFLLGDIKFVKGDFTVARAIYESIVKSFPGDYYANNALERMIILQAYGPEITPDAALSRFADGIREILKGNRREAALILSDSVIIASPLSEHAMYFAAMLYGDGGDRTAAINEFRRYIDTFPKGTYLDRAYYALGDLYMQSKDSYQLAVAAFNTVLERFSVGPVVEKARERLRQIGAVDKIG